MNRIPEKIHSIDFCLSVGCNVKCRFCPQDILLNNYARLKNSSIRQLSYDNFKKVLGQVRESAAVSFAGMSEPFANPDCARMIKYAYEQGYKITLFTTLKGVTKKDLETIENVEFTTVTIHIPDKQENSFFPVTKEYREILAGFSQRIKIDAYSCHGEIADSIRDLVDEDIYINSHIMNRAGNLSIEGLQEYSHKGKLFCSSGTVNGTNGQTPVVLPNGDVTMCATDYGLQGIIGNLLEQSWSEIITGEAYINIERAWDDESIPVLCRTCPEARVKKDKTCHYNHLSGSSAIKIGRYMTSDEGRADDDLSVLERLQKAKNICIWGIGKLFKDNYFSKSWDLVCQGNLFCDTDPEKWGQQIHGITCIEPKKLEEYEDLLIITFVKNDEELKTYIEQELGLTNVINIFDIYNALD